MEKSSYPRGMSCPSLLSLHFSKYPNLMSSFWGPSSFISYKNAAPEIFNILVFYFVNKYLNFNIVMSCRG